VTGSLRAGVVDVCVSYLYLNVRMYVELTIFNYKFRTCVNVSVLV
jgi:hypothetical protein